MKNSADIYYGNPQGLDDIQQILALQEANLRENTTEQVWADQGFVTVKHNEDLLAKMNAAEPQIIAKANDEVIAYALVMPIEFAEYVPILRNLFKLLKSLSYQGKPMKEFNYYVMGQVCVSEHFRGQGIFDGLYQQHKKQMAGRYDFVVTEIAARNPRSIRAHQRVGFKTIHEYTSQNGDGWAIVLWDWS